MLHLAWGAGVSLGTRSRLGCAGSIPTAEQNPLLARLKPAVAGGTSVPCGEGDPRGWSLRNGGARLLPARRLARVPEHLASPCLSSLSGNRG